MRLHRSSRRLIALRTTVVLLALYLDPESAVRAQAPSSTAEPESGHARMVALLATLAEQTARDNPYLGERDAPRMRAQLAAMPEDGDALARFKLHFLLGRDELRLGNLDAAMGHYRESDRLISQYQKMLTPADVVPLVLEMGIAQMRLAETQNCVKHHTADSCILPIRTGGQHVDRAGSERAIAYFGLVLKLAPPNSPPYTRARWLLNVAHMTLGQYPAGVPEAWRIPAARFESDEPIERFPDRAPELGLNAFDLAGGAVVEDYDGDGDLDILTSTMDSSGPLHFYRNDGNGRFSERTKEANLDGLLGGLNMNHADYDNDGDVDVLVLRGGWFRSLGRHPNSLLRNDGNGRFTDVTFDAGLGDVHYPTQTAGWADYDNDGDLDLYVGNEHDEEIAAPGQLFRNDGNGRFTDVAKQAGVTNDRFCKGVAWGDQDRDGDPDLYLSNLGSANRLYRNNGDGSFTDIAVDAGVTLPTHSFPTWFWDIDNDGMLDIYAGSYHGRVEDVAAGYLNQKSQLEPDRLYRGTAEGFEEVATRYDLTRPTIPMGSNWGDLDNDGYPDFYLGTGYPEYEGIMPNLMFLNREGKRFVDVSTAGGFAHLQKGHAVVFADLDRDGDQDVYEQIGGAYPGDAFGNALFENPGFGNHWVKVRLVGVRSNRFGVGARIRIDVLDGGRLRPILRDVGSGGSFGANPFTQEIGLGSATRIERLEIYWPTSGITQRFENVPVDRLVRIVEDQETFAVSSQQPFALGAAPAP